jgi:hypothetical protein
MPRRGLSARVVAEPDVAEGAFDRLQASIDPQWVDEALEATGTATVRRRRLPAEQVIWLVLGMALYRQRPIDEVVAKLDLALPGRRGPTAAPSAVVQARARLGEEPMRWLFERCSEMWAYPNARRCGWRGLAVCGVDGTTARVPDSRENHAHFGGQRGRRGNSGYPQARIVTLKTLRTYLPRGGQVRPVRRERDGLRQGSLAAGPDNALVVVDRNFFDAGVLVPLASHGACRHWLSGRSATCAGVW